MNSTVFACVFACYCTEINQHKPSGIHNCITPLCLLVKSPFPQHFSLLNPWRFPWNLETLFARNGEASLERFDG